MTRYHTNKNGNTAFSEAEEEAADAADTAAANQVVPNKWIKIRAKRDQLMAACDWMALPDSPAISDSWTEYRSALRNLPASQADPDDIIWPTAPS